MSFSESATAFETSTGYGATPWSGLSANQRDWYVPELLMQFVRQSIFYRMVPYQVDLAARRTQTMHFTQVIDPEPDINERELRGLWLPDLYMDSKSLEIGMSSYGGKVQCHKFDELITYWQESGQAGLIPILRNRLSKVMVQTLDILARNAFLSNQFGRSFAGSASTFGTLTASDTFDPSIARDIWLMASYEQVNTNQVFPAFFSPAAVHSAKEDSDSDYITWSRDLQSERLMNFAVGQFEDVQFSAQPTMTLWNVGTVLAQASITSSVEAGDGAPNPASEKVDGVWQVGQSGMSASHYYIQLSSITNPGSAETGFKTGDLITIHRDRPSADSEMAVANGVTWNHYANVVRRIHSIDYDNNRIVLETPVLNDFYEDEISTGLYGYVTKARDVHAALFLFGPQGVVAGVGQPPQFYQHDAIDDRKAIWRFTWDAYMKYAIMYPRRFAVHFHAGPSYRAGEIVNI